MKYFVVFAAILALALTDQHGRIKTDTLKHAISKMKHFSGEPVGPQDRIVNGSPVDILQHPYIVALITSSGRVQFCGGSIITTRTIVTAAHCVQYKQNNYRQMAPADIIAVAGVHDLSNPDRVDCKIKTIIAHASHRTKDPDYDLAVLHTIDEITFTLRIKPIPLAKSVPMSSLVTVAGWGRTETGQPATTLRHVMLKIFENTYCATALNLKEDVLTERMICGGTIPSDDPIAQSSCFGDSGGPMVFNNDGSDELLGIVSFGKECPKPSIYLNVTNVDINNFITGYTIGST